MMLKDSLERFHFTGTCDAVAQKGRGDKVHTPPPSVAAKEWKTTTYDAGRLAALKQLPLTKPNPMLGSILRFPSLTVSYCTLANKHVTTDALAYHCLRHDLSTFLRFIDSLVL